MHHCPLLLFLRQHVVAPFAYCAPWGCVKALQHRWELVLERAPYRCLVDVLDDPIRDVDLQQQVTGQVPNPCPRQIAAVDNVDVARSRAHLILAEPRGDERCAVRIHERERCVQIATPLVVSLPAPAPRPLGAAPRTQANTPFSP